MAAHDSRAEPGGLSGIHLPINPGRASTPGCRGSVFVLRLMTDQPPVSFIARHRNLGVHGEDGDHAYLYGCYDDNCHIGYFNRLKLDLV